MRLVVFNACLSAEMVESRLQPPNGEPPLPGPGPAPKPRAERATALYNRAEIYRRKGQLSQAERLPADAERELAAKGARGRPFAWGTERPRPDGVAFGGTAYGLAGPRDVALSARDRTPEGVFDLGGNVAEWTQGSAGAEREVARGGGWAGANLCHVLSSGCAFPSAAPSASDPEFRCARSDGARAIGFR
ncbi:MAG TPA: SUMF1/EgtB/PvdO family nonheme iron enzyme [Polyangiaceae bacterium]|nr:SUMF1/EgtB/PvdO family nonheme iron enzyme [Polyangiaceae bacterium]